MATISAILKLCQNPNYIKWAESHNYQSGENQISISKFITEIDTCMLILKFLKLKFQNGSKKEC